MIDFQCIFIYLQHFFQLKRQYFSKCISYFVNPNIKNESYQEIELISVLPEEKGSVDAVEPGVYQSHTEGHLEPTGQDLSVRSLRSCQPDGKTG